ncbi:unnamed protein product [Cladocopium goreaui]|uniref:Uncharacterized protein n=1 Tax=Cladocopium goreaui TaxID=2562237 RepID=A0A9P1FGT8_9DINO|nr:unnamed protein product [Cladocopium goreaui]
MVCQWTSEEQHVVLEVPDGEDSKSTSDSERTSWAQLLQEMEENKVSDPTINQHDLHAPVTDDGIPGRHRYLIKPKAAPIYFQYAGVTTNFKYTNCASAFTTEELDASRVLTKVWRVFYHKESNEISPRKPLYFFDSDIDMAEGAVLRLL